MKICVVICALLARRWELFLCSCLDLAMPPRLQEPWTAGHTCTKHWNNTAGVLSHLWCHLFPFLLSWGKCLEIVSKETNSFECFFYSSPPPLPPPGPNLPPQRAFKVAPLLQVCPCCTAKTFFSPLLTNSSSSSSSIDMFLDSYPRNIHTVSAVSLQNPGG